MVGPGQLHTRFKTPEGHFTLFSERPTRVGFSAQRMTRLTVAELPTSDGRPAIYIIFNVSDFLHICPYAETHREPVRSIYFGTRATTGATSPTCHDFTAASDGLDLLVGLSNGEVLVASLRAQLDPAHATGKASAMLHFNLDRVVNRTRCQAAAWVPGTQGGAFVAAHFDGQFLIYHKGAAAGEQRLTTALKSITSIAGGGPAKTVATGGGKINALAVSPDGTLVATASQDGVCRLFDFGTGRLVGGFKSYYGGLLCCTWSPDGLYLAAGGEDDLVALYSVADRETVAWGEAHGSWVSAVAFDTWCAVPLSQVGVSGEGHALAALQRAHQAPSARSSPSPASSPASPLRPSPASPAAARDGVLRLVSGGQDCEVALWDFSTAGEDPVGLSRGGRPAPRSSEASASRVLFAADEAMLLNGDTNGVSSLVEMSTSSVTSNGRADVIAPSVPRADMDIQPPLTIRRVHTEPISSVAVTKEAFFTACYGGSIRCWKRPEPPAAPLSRAAAAAAHVTVSLPRPVRPVPLPRVPPVGGALPVHRVASESAMSQ